MRRGIAVFFGLCALLQSCSDPGSAPSGLEGRRLWGSLGLRDYAMTQEVNCFCPNTGRTVRIVVRADTIDPLPGTVDDEVLYMTSYLRAMR